MLNLLLYVKILAFLSTRVAGMDDIMTLISEFGYPVENHTVTTEDNYLLTVHRIPPKLPGAKVIFAMHGLFSSASDYIVFGPKYSMGYILHDAGYDVWLGNSRGTTFSRQHKFLDPNVSSAFWDYSFNEIGRFDLPAMIDYVLTATNRSSLHYVGHSQGCTVFFVMLALRPEYNEKIASMHAMAPAAYMSSSQAVDRMFIATLDQLELVSRTLELYEVSTSRPEFNGIARILAGTCKEKTIFQLLCFEALFYSVGSTAPRLTEEMAAHLMRNTPNIASVKQLIHFGQIIRSGKFQQFNYNKVKNMQMYNRRSPPLYNLTNVHCDIQIIYGTGDNIVHPTDVEKLIESFGDRVVDVVIVSGANHFDFVFSANGKKDFYSKIIAYIDNKFPL